MPRRTTAKDFYAACAQAHILHEHGKCRNEPESAAVYHGTQEYHNDAELLRTCYIRLCKGRDGAADGLICGRIYYYFYYFWKPKYVIKSDEK